MNSCVETEFFYKLTCRLEHGFNRDSIAARRVVDQYVRHRARELTVLNDRTSGHSLNDAAGFLDQSRIGHANDHRARMAFGRRVHLFNLNIIRANFFSADTG